MLTRLDRITTRAESQPTATFDNVYSLLTCELLWHAFRKLKRDKAPGVDGETVDQYEANLREWRSLMKYREAARRMALRWMRRRSQNSWISWDAYNAYLRQHPLAVPGRLVDLIAMARGS